MATIYIGSARVDERRKYFGGSVGDQKQKSSTNDLIGEVSMQPMYIHSKGWYIYRPKKVEIANALASAMFISCNNKNLGYKAYMEDELAIFEDAWILFKSKVKNLDEEKTIYSAYREVADEFKIKYIR